VRSSFSNWQPGYSTGVVAAQKGYKRAMTITWNYAAGVETGEGLRRGVREGRWQGHEGPDPAVSERRIPGAADARSRRKKPDVVFAFFAGAGAVKFVKDYAAAG